MLEHKNLFDYLLLRLDQRLKSFQTDRLLLINTVSLDDLKKNKAAIIQIFIQIEDDLRYCSQAISSLLMVNRDIMEENKFNWKSQKKILDKKLVDLEINLNKERSLNIQFREEILSFKIEKDSQVDKLLKSNWELERMIQEKDILIKKQEETITGQQKDLLQLQNELDKLRDRRNSNTDQEKAESQLIIPQDDNQFSYSDYLAERNEKKKRIFKAVQEQFSEDDNTRQKQLGIIYEDSPKKEKDSDRELLERRDHLIEQMNSERECLNYLEERIGLDFLSKLLARELNASFLDKVEKALKEYNKIKC